MRTSIKASEGYVLTNGDIYGVEIFLAEGVDESAFYQITLEEYEAKMKAKRKEREMSDLLTTQNNKE